MGHDRKTEGMDTGYIHTGDRRVIYHISVISYLWNKKINKKRNLQMLFGDRKYLYD